MKKILFIALSGLFLTSCFGVKQVGSLNMVSSRNVDLESGQYELIKTYAGSSSKKELKKEFKKVQAKNLEEAIDYTVKSTAGGEFLANVKVFLLNGTYFIVQGDVWGKKGVVADYKGFKVGDRVQYTRAMVKRTGEISDLKNNEEATIKEDKDGGYHVIKYDKLIKVK